MMVGLKTSPQVALTTCCSADPMSGLKTIRNVRDSIHNVPADWMGKEWDDAVASESMPLESGNKVEIGRMR